MYYDRKEAGKILGLALKKYSRYRPLIIALPRGGVPVGYEVSKLMEAPMDVIFIRKLGHPLNREYAIGAVSSTGFCYDPSISGIAQSYIYEEVARLQKLVKEKEQLYYKGFRRQNIKGKWIILIDDGIATGNTILAAANLLSQQKPSAIVVGVPVGPEETVRKLIGNPIIDEVVCLEIPDDFGGVGQFYENFDPVEDSEAIALLKNANATCK